MLTTLSELFKTKLNSNKDSERNIRQGSCQELESSRTVLLFHEHPIEGDRVVLILCGVGGTRWEEGTVEERYATEHSGGL